MDVLTPAECSSNFEIRADQCNPEKLGICKIEKMEDALVTINTMVRPLKSKIAKYDRIILLYVLIGLMVTIGLAIIALRFIHFSLSIIIVLIYFIILAILIKVLKKKQGSLIKHSHFCLALVL